MALRSYENIAFLHYVKKQQINMDGKKKHGTVLSTLYTLYRHKMNLYLIILTIFYVIVINHSISQLRILNIRWFRSALRSTLRFRRLSEMISTSYGATSMRVLFGHADDAHRSILRWIDPMTRSSVTFLVK